MASLASAEEVAAHIETALRLKEQGNVHFQNRNFKEALVAYHQSFMYVHGIDNQPVLPNQGFESPRDNQAQATPEQKIQVRKIKIAHFSNVCACNLKLEKFEKARENATKALALDDSHVKCLFRRGKCNAMLGDLDEAKEDLNKVLSLDEGNREAMRELAALKTKFADRRKREQRKFTGFFDKLSKHSTDDVGTSAAVGHVPSNDTTQRTENIDAGTPGAAENLHSAQDASTSLEDGDADGGGGSAALHDPSSDAKNSVAEESETFEPLDASIKLLDPDKFEWQTPEGFRY